MDDGAAEGDETIELNIVTENLYEASSVLLSDTSATITIEASSAEFSTTEASPSSYINVDVEDHYVDSDSTTTLTFTVTWSDVEDCSSNYNAYLYKSPRADLGGAPTLMMHLGSDPSADAEIVKTISRLHSDTESGFSTDADGYVVKVYCGTDSGREVSSAKISNAINTATSNSTPYRPHGIFYTSHPKLASLNISPDPVSMRPPTSRYTHEYFVVVSDNAVSDGRRAVTITPTADDGYSYVPFTRDVSSRTPGYQVALYKGEVKEVIFYVQKLLWTNPITYAKHYEPNYALYNIYIKRLPTPPAISGITSTNYDENGTSAVGTYSLTAEGATNVRWSLLGDDSNDFSLSDDDAPVLSFQSSPNYEDTRDADGDNVYEVTVRVGYYYHADDGIWRYTSYELDVTVTVVNVNESPSLNS